ncbi:fatty acid desaturase-domain-containing protein [Chytriomyces cf. hyalinus JEL632]|nr:fatty acid desaturase-domain-containing protein [Chytriomyces cf. hyalinus JEL632]
MTGVRTFTWAEIEQSALKKKTILDVEKGGPAYMAIHNKVYDIGAGTGFFRMHPGGAVAISQLGKDASGAFEVFHTENAEAMMSDFYVGDLDPKEIGKPNEFKKDIEILRTKLTEMGCFESSKLYYVYKVASTLSICLASAYLVINYGRTSTLAVVAAGLLMAVFFQQSGWLAHDFLHHQVFKNRTYNDAMGYMIGNVWQGFSVSWWKDKHCVHHSVPNIHGEDPDINTMPFLAWSEHALEMFSDFKDTDVARFMITNQPILFFPILGVARMAWATSSIRFNLGDKVINPTQALIEKLTLAVHWSWYLTLTFAFCTPLRALLFLFLSQCGCGLLLAFVFTVNHNGMPVYSPQEAKQFDFYELQVVTGRDVISTTFSDWFTGGLNYQIEHHMFPTLPRHSFAKVQPLVEELCKKHDVSFHKTSLLGGASEILDRLSGLAKQAAKIRYAAKSE